MRMALRTYYYVEHVATQGMLLRLFQAEEHVTAASTGAEQAGDQIAALQQELADARGGLEELGRLLKQCVTTMIKIAFNSF